MPFAFQPYNPKPLAVACHIVVDAGVAHSLTSADLDFVAPHQLAIEVEADSIHALAEERSGDELTFASALSMKQRSRHSRCARQPHRVIPHPASLKRRIAAGRREHRSNPRSCPKSCDVIGRSVGIGAFGAVAGDAAIDELGVISAESCVIQAQAFKSA